MGGKPFRLFVAPRLVIVLKVDLLAGFRDSTSLRRCPQINLRGDETPQAFGALT
jgi:hypothetical protein